MAIVEIPLRSTIPSYKFRIPLEGIFYTFKFEWNTRMTKWMFSILTQDETPIIEGVPCITNYQFVKRFSQSNLPPGKIFLVDTSGDKIDPGRYDLGERVKMFYEENA